MEGGFLVVVFLLGGLLGLGEGCLEQEKEALLQLKPFFYLRQSPTSSSKRYVLYNWVEEGEDCCQWENVECDATTGRVSTLTLTNTLLVGYPFYDDMKSWYLNASLFLPFEDLKTLSLTGNGIAGCLSNHGFEMLARKLNKLEVLDLSVNNFEDSNVLTSLLEFSSLKSLNLSYNNLNGPIHTKGFGEVSTKSSIEILDLSFNDLDDSILVALSELSSLKHLNLTSNQILGSSNINGFKELSYLETLSLRGNVYLESNILSHIGDISSLKTLDLEYCDLKGTIQFQEIFNNLKNLKELYLMGNEIESLGSFPEDERQSGLVNLEVLSLTLNTINNSMLSSLGPFSKSLTRLYIDIQDLIRGYIDMEDARERGLKYLKGVDLVGVKAAKNSIVPQSLGLFPSLKTLHFEFEFADYNQELRNLSSLEELIVESATMPTNFLEYIGNLTSLRVLFLTGHGQGNLSIQGPLDLKNLESLTIEDFEYLENSILKNVGAMTSLKNLSLSNCGLTGTLSAQDICELTSLRELDISQNNLTGTLPDCFPNLTLLRHLNLSSNQFSGDLSFFVSFTSMEYIDISHNQFQIPSSLKPLFNHSKLNHFNGGNNHIFAETDVHSLAPQFQLKFISLSCCGNGGTLPKFLHHQHELQYVDLSNINLTGEFPSWLLKNNAQLETLFLLNNSLSGHLKLPFHSPRRLLIVDISNNFLDGYIPTEIGKHLPGLKYLNMSRNSLDGGIPSSIGDMKLLQILDLSNNKLSGIIPDSLAMNCFLLGALILSNNRLQGRMFSSNFNLTELRMLELGGNNFTGEIPSSLTKSASLSIIDISDNHISGRIPPWLGNMSLMVIIMLNNHIEGPIPMELCQLTSLAILDLSMNNISGKIPSCFEAHHFLVDLHLSKNRLHGSIPGSIYESWNLVALDLSHNDLSGIIPSRLGNLSELSYIVLKNNNLEGEIPNQLCQLEKLSLIDLSQNNLSGGIPPCLNVTSYTGESTYLSSLLSVIDSELARVELSTDYGSIDLTTKSITYSYKGRNLRFLSAIDLSCNKLNGEIPHQMGNSYIIHMLNLSHNSLRGPIPASLSNLTQIESLDLSYNNLSGGIPPQFVQLNFLAYFNVSYNNLSGKPPPRAGQFASNIDENSYWGNPFFCGECLLPNRSSTIKPPSNSTQHHQKDEGGFIDIESFYVTFGVSYIMVLLGIAAVLYINPYWRRAWFYFVERVVTTCFYFVIDNFLPRRYRFCYI